MAFGRLEEGYENAMKDYNKKQIQQLNNLITMLLGDLTKGDRQKIMTICTIDVHARDVVAKMIAQKVCEQHRCNNNHCKFFTLYSYNDLNRSKGKHEVMYS